MRIEVIHFGEDYATVEIQKHKSLLTYEINVPIEVAKQAREILTAVERLLTSQAIEE